MYKLFSILFLTLLLTACKTTLLNEEFGYKLYKTDSTVCSEAIEFIETNDEYSYYFECLKSHWFIIKNIDGDEFNIYEILENELLTIEELYILFEGELHRTEPFE